MRKTRCFLLPSSPLTTFKVASYKGEGPVITMLALVPPYSPPTSSLAQVDWALGGPTVFAVVLFLLIAACRNGRYFVKKAGFLASRSVH